MFTAVARAFWRHQHGLVPRGFDHQLLAAATFQRNEPEGRGFHAVAAGAEQAVVLVDGGKQAGEQVVERGADEHNLNSKKEGAPYKHHPGAKAKPYMRPAFFAKHAEALEVFKNRLKVAIVRSVTATPRKKSA